MVVTCPHLLLSDVRNVVVPSLQYMLRSTSDHDELGKRLFRDPSLLVVGVGPLARLQYTLEQYRAGTASIAMGNLGAAVGPEAALPTAQGAATPGVGGGGGSGSGGGSRSRSGKAVSARSKRRRAPSPQEVSSAPLEEDQSRLLPPVVVPQVSDNMVSCSC